MQKQIFKENYFGTLMCILVDESRRMFPAFMPTQELHQIQNDMCKAGSWINHIPVDVIIQTVPQQSIQKLQQDALPKYRLLAAKLIETFIESFKTQGGDAVKLRQHFEKLYNWKQ